MPNHTSIEALNTLSLLEDLLETPKVDKASIRIHIKRLKGQITQLGNEITPSSSK